MARYKCRLLTYLLNRTRENFLCVRADFRPLYLVEIGVCVAFYGVGVTQQALSFVLNASTHLLSGVVDESLGVTELLLERLALYAQRRHQTISFGRQLSRHLQRSQLSLAIPPWCNGRVSDLRSRGSGFDSRSGSLSSSYYLDS